jgi:hypothetical protein
LKVSPTIFRWREFRFFFFSREERRPHVHVSGPEGEVKLWIDPFVEVASSHGLSPETIRAIRRTVEDKLDEITSAWHRHFEG